MMIVLRLVYGSYEWQICTQLLHFLTALGYYRKGWCFNIINCHVHHCALYMGHTSMCRFHTTVFWQLLVSKENDDVSMEPIVFWSLSLVYDPYEHVPISYNHFLTASGFYRKMMMFQRNLFWGLGCIFQFFSHVDHRGETVNV